MGNMNGQNESKVAILVDDEAEILDNFLYKAIREHLKDFECFSCKTTTEAKELTDYLDSEGRTIPLFIIDEVMKGSPETGNDLLAYFDQTHPRARKILLSGQATDEEIIKALNEAGADTYVPKKDVLDNPKKLLKTIDDLLLDYYKEEGIKFIVKDKDGKNIVIRPAETAYDIHQAAKLVYLVYNDIEKRYREGVLTEEQIRRREKWDSADFDEKGRINPLSKHFVAMKDGECIGCVRLWMEAGPLDGFDFGTGDKLTLRAGKWMVHPNYRIAMLPIEVNFEDKLNFKSPIAIPLLIHSFISAKYEFKENEIYLTCLPKLKSTYSKLGFKQVGEPFEHETLKGDPDGEFPGKYIGMKMNIDETYAEYLNIITGKIKPEDSELNTSILNYILMPLNNSNIKNFITQYRTPWERYSKE